MDNKSDVLRLVQSAARKKLLFSSHAIRQMVKPERFITIPEIKSAIYNGMVIEDYPKDPRGHSCLILGFGEKDRPIHIVCAPKIEYLAIITAYIPDPGQWYDNYRIRGK
jgi:hypothetical protein